MSRPAAAEALILGILEQQHALSAPSIVVAMEEQGWRANKTTIYRAIDKLLGKGLLCRQYLHDETAVYERRDHHHDHAVCEQCGGVTIVGCQIHDLAVPSFEVHHHHLTLYGVCQKCKNRMGDYSPTRSPLLLKKKN